jgi:4-diphosphocytidyl-2-C-methyl-D-erythritol kinase
MTVTVRSFAKINLGLRIGAAREDGFHDLVTVYQTIGLHDVIRVGVERGRGIEIRCSDPRVPRDDSNTCFRIVELAVAALRAKGRVIIAIEKRLPVQGGLGGASANAVAALVGLEREVKKSLGADDRLRIAAEVGSDLPLFLVGGTILGLGRGEQVYPLADFPAAACVVLIPEVGVSTPKAFAEWDRRMGTQGLERGSVKGAEAELRTGAELPPGAEVQTVAIVSEAAAELRSAGPTGSAVPKKATAKQFDAPKLTLSDVSVRMNELSRGTSAWLSEPYSGAPSGRGRAENPLLELVRAGIENDFEQVVFPEYPELREGKRALVRAGAKYASLSGSGSTLYGLFGSRAEAVRAAIRLGKQGWAAQVTRTLTRSMYWRRLIAG